MRVLVTGDRDWDDPGLIHAVLTGLYHEYAVGYNVVHMEPFVVIEGGARGADREALWWAGVSPLHAPAQPKRDDECPVLWEQYPADWKRYGRAAGPIRNQRMLTHGKPDLVLAFHHDLGASKGTADMVARARKAGVKVVVIG